MLIKSHCDLIFIFVITSDIEIVWNGLSTICISYSVTFFILYFAHYFKVIPHFLIDLQKTYTWDNKTPSFLYVEKCIQLLWSLMQGFLFLPFYTEFIFYNNSSSKQYWVESAEFLDFSSPLHRVPLLSTYQTTALYL